MENDGNLSDDFQELSLERTITTYKSAEELERLTVDEQLNPIERAVYLLSSGQEVQRISVISNFPELLTENNAECMRRVVPKVREVLHVAQAEMQLAACSAFLQILQKQLIPLHSYTQTFLQTIIMSLDSRDTEVANAWLETLLDVIDLLPKDVIKKDIMNIAIAKGQLSQSVQSRLSCCRILGKVATKFEPFLIKKDILPVVQSLCQDVEYEVRSCMCRELEPVARGLGLEQTKSAILPELVELTNDEESTVRLAGLETVVNILSLLDDDTCSSTIIPLVCKFCQQAISNDDSTLPTVAKQLGRLCHGLSVNLMDEQKRFFVDYYKKLCHIGLSDSSKQKDIESPSCNRTMQPFSLFPGGDPIEEEDPHEECRKNAGYNFPAMVLFAGARNLKSELHTTFSNLCTDPSHHVRKTVAAGFHEVAKLLGNQVHLIQEDFIGLLGDDSIEVLKGLVGHLPETLGMFSKCSNHSNSVHKSTSSILDVIPALIECEATISSSNNWRLQEQIVDQLSCLPNCFSSSDIYQKFIPLTFMKLHTARALPVRHAAAKTLLILLRHNRRLEQRQEMITRIIDEFCHGRSCHQRSLFVDLCRLALDLYSRNFFKEHLFQRVLELSSDKVANVRLRLCPLLPRLKSLLKLPTDRARLQQLEQCVRKLLVNETDKDCSVAVDQAVKELDRVQVQMESLTKKAFIEEDLADQRKEEEEKLLLELEEKEKREEEGKSAKGERKQSIKKEMASKIPAPKKGSKIPAATSITRDHKTQGSIPAHARTERSGSFGGIPSIAMTKEIKRTLSFNHKSNKTASRTSTTRAAAVTSPRPTNRTPGAGAASPSSRKSSASSISSSTSVGSSGSRRSSHGSDGTKKSTAQRRIPAATVAANGGTRKK